MAASYRRGPVAVKPTMRLALQRHPQSEEAGASSLAVEVVRERSGRLRLRYGVKGELEDLLVPPPAPRGRTDELWRHSCFEAFVRYGPEADYFEFNLSPSGEWAAYRFNAYRDGMAEAELPGPVIETRSADTSFELNTVLDLSLIAGLPVDAPWRLGLAAILEDVRGYKSYWALAHPPGKPDFHHDDAFALHLSALELP
jgi:hypothetical protein